MARFILSSCIVILTLWVMPAGSQTPDGQTPAEEAVCDPLKASGVTPGLYGLCIAFCEAQDWETDCLNDPETCGQSGARLLQNYNQRKQPTDPSMPCLVTASECPCWNGEEGAISGGNTLADVWVANAPSLCDDDDLCSDQVLGDSGTASFARCVEAETMHRFDTQSFVVGDSFGVCVVSRRNDDPPLDILILTDLATGQKCLAEHDTFTAGGTFPSHNTESCGLPTP